MLISHLVYVCVLSHFSHVRLFVTLWTIARQAPLPTEFSRQEYWGGYHCLLQGSPLIQGWNSISCLLPWQVGSLPLGQPGKPRWMITDKETKSSGSRRVGDLLSRFLSAWAWKKHGGWEVVQNTKRLLLPLSVRAAVSHAY